MRIRVVRIFRRVSEHVRKLSSVGAAPYFESEDPEEGGREGVQPPKPRLKGTSLGRGSLASAIAGGVGSVRLPHAVLRSMLMQGA